MLGRSVRKRETHLAAGGRENIHGTTFPQALVTLLFLRAVRQGQEFQIATEVKEAGKFDDIVICNIKDGKKFYRLIQIKYKLDPKKSKVTFYSLTSTNKNADLSLIVYFNSFRQMKTEFTKDGRDISKLILYTNGEINGDDRGNLGEHVLKISESFSSRSNRKGVAEVDELLETKLVYIKEDVKGIWKKFLKENTEKDEDIDQDAEKFLEKICLAVNQPGEEEIRKMILNELQHQGVVNTKQAYLSVNHYILEWIKEKQGYFLDKFDGLDLIDQLMREYGFIEFGVEKPVTNFVGRNEELKQIKAAYEKGDKRFLISGLGGIGKTQLAKMFLEKNRNIFNCIVWMKAECQEDLIDSFQRLAFQKLCINKEGSDGKERDFHILMEEVNQWFQKRKSLLVLDNITKNKTESIAVSYVDELFPKLTSVSFILMTSRYKCWDDIPGFHLNEFSREEAAEMIKISLKNLEKTEEEIEFLTKLLQYYPLSLQQAVAYIKKNDEKAKIFNYHFGLASYIQIFNDNLNSLLSHTVMRLNNDKYTETTLTTWEITMKDVREAEDGFAEEVLKVLAYFKDDDIHVDDILKCFKESLANAIKDSIILLHQYSMINCKESIIKVHKVVQRITRYKLKVEEEITVLEITMKAIANLSTNNKISIWEHASKHQDLVKKYVEVPGLILQSLAKEVRYEEGHLFGKKCLSILGKYFHASDERIIKFFTEVASAAYNNGKFSEALDLYKELYSRLKNSLGELHSSTLSTRRKIAMVLCEMGKYDEALTLMKKVSEDIKNVFPLEHKTAMGIRCDIAYLLGKLAKHNDSLMELKEVYDIARTSLGEECKETLIIRQSIAYTLLNSGNYAQSLSIYNDLVEIFERVFGKQHPDVLNIKRNIAYNLGKLGRYNKSLAIYEEVFHQMEHILGKKHPDRLQTGCNIAHTLAELGKYEECFGMYKEVFYYSKEVLGKQHPITLNAGRCVSFALGKLGKNEESLLMYKDMYQLMKNILGEDHPDTLSTKRNIAFTLIELGKYNEALVLYANVYRHLQKIFGDEHLDTLTTRCNIAFTQEKLGRNKESKMIYEDVYKIMCRSLGANHPDSLNTRCCIVSVFYKVGKFHESLEIYEDVYNIRREVLGENHPQTFNAGCKIAACFHGLGRNRESLEMYEKIYSNMQQAMGKNHVEVLHARCGMAAAFGELGDYSKSLIIYKEVYQLMRNLFDEDHKENLKIKNSIALALEKLEEYEESSVTYQEVYDCMRRTLGNDHPETLSARGDTVKMLVKLEKYEESIELYKIIYDDLARIIGLEHPETLNYKCMIAFTLSLSKKYDESLAVYKEVYSTMKRVLGKEHITTLKVKCQMALVLGNLGEYDKSLIILRKVYDSLVRELGEQHPETLNTKGNIAFILGILKKYDESLVIYNEVYQSMGINHGSKHKNTVRMKENIAYIQDKLKHIHVDN